jgi:hypothetical protein
MSSWPRSFRLLLLITASAAAIGIGIGEHAIVNPLTS